MWATRAVIWVAGALVLAGALGPSAGCGPHGVRKVIPGQGEDAGEETGGSGGDNTGGGSGGMSGKGGTGGGGTGGNLPPDAGRDVAPDVAQVQPDVGPDLAPDVNAMEAPPPDVMGAPCSTSMNGAWVNNPFPAKNGMFTVTFEGTSSSATGDVVMGLSSGTATAFTAMAVIVRFGTSGNIDARNGGAYAAASTIAYAANMTYRVRLVVDVAAKRFSAYVTPPGGQEQLLGMNYAFRTEQNNVTSLNSWVVHADAPGNARMCGFAVQ